MNYLHFFNSEYPAKKMKMLIQKFGQKIYIFFCALPPEEVGETPIANSHRIFNAMRSSGSYFRGL